MIKEAILILSAVVSTSLVMAVAGAVVGEMLRFISRRITSPRISWLFGNLSPEEGFGLGLLMATLLVAGAYSAASGGVVGYGSAWFRYAAGAAIAFVIFCLITRNKRMKA